MYITYCVALFQVANQTATMVIPDMLPGHKHYIVYCNAISIILLVFRNHLSSNSKSLADIVRKGLIDAVCVHVA